VLARERSQGQNGVDPLALPVRCVVVVRGDRMDSIPFFGDEGRCEVIVLQAFAPKGTSYLAGDRTTLPPVQVSRSPTGKANANGRTHPATKLPGGPARQPFFPADA
jgi:hypothetical protein